MLQNNEKNSPIADSVKANKSQSFLHTDIYCICIQYNLHASHRKSPIDWPPVAHKHSHRSVVFKFIYKGLKRIFQC